MSRVEMAEMGSGGAAARADDDDYDEHIDDSTGKRYFVHRESGEATWERPEKSDKADQTSKEPPWTQNPSFRHDVSAKGGADGQDSVGVDVRSVASAGGGRVVRPSSVASEAFSSSPGSGDEDESKTSSSSKTRKSMKQRVVGLATKINYSRSASAAEAAEKKAEAEAADLEKKRREMNPVKLFLVELVNPKFVRFNRPLILAALVGILTLAAVLVVYIATASICKTASYTAANYYDAMEFIETINNNGEKLVSMSKQVVDTERLRVTWQECLPRSPDLSINDIDPAIKWEEGSLGWNYTDAKTKDPDRWGKAIAQAEARADGTLWTVGLQAEAAAADKSIEFAGIDARTQ